MTLVLLSLLAICLLVAPIAQASKTSLDEVWLTVSSQNYSEASAIYQMVENTWKDQPPATGRTAFSRNRFAMGMRERWVSLEYIERNDWVFVFSPDTAQLLYLEGSDQPIPSDQEYQLDLQVQHLAARGVRVGFHLPEWQNIQLITYFSVLQGRHFQEGRLQGNILQPNPRDYQGQAQLDYYYSEDLLLEHQIDRPSGHGGAVDIELHWQAGAWQASLIAEDLWMRMTWDDAGRTQGQLNTNNTQYNDSGFVRYNPVFNGSRGIDEFRQQGMPAMTRGSLSWNGTEQQLRAGAWHYHDKLFPFFTLNQQLTEHGKLIAGYEFNSDKITLGYHHQQQHGHIAIQLGADDTNLRYARALELTLQADYRF